MQPNNRINILNITIVWFSYIIDTQFLIKIKLKQINIFNEVKV